MLLLRVGKETMHQYSELHITPILLMHHFRKQRCDSSLIANILCHNSLLSWWLLPSLLQDCFPVTGFLKSDTFGPSKTFFFFQNHLPKGITSYIQNAVETSGPQFHQRRSSRDETLLPMMMMDVGRLVIWGAGLLAAKTTGQASSASWSSHLQRMSV